MQGNRRCAHEGPHHLLRGTCFGRTTSKVTTGGRRPSRSASHCRLSSAERQQTQVPRTGRDTKDDVIQYLVRRTTNLASRQCAIAVLLELSFNEGWHTALQFFTDFANSVQILQIPQILHLNQDTRRCAGVILMLQALESVLSPRQIQANNEHFSLSCCYSRFSFRLPL